MAEFIAGARRFQQEMQEPSATYLRDKFTALAAGQSPDVLFITCADSRIDPCLITDSEPGALLISRNPGNFVPPLSDPAMGEAMGDAAGEGSGEATAAAIEFALEGLRVSHIVICGHSDCGAIKAAREGVDAQQMPQLASWIAHAPASPALPPPADQASEGARSRDTRSLTSLVEKNIRVQIKNLSTHPSVKEALAEGRLVVHGWIYDIGGCEIRALNPKTDIFEKL